MSTLQILVLIPLACIPCVSSQDNRVDTELISAPEVLTEMTYFLQEQLKGKIFYLYTERIHMNVHEFKCILILTWWYLSRNSFGNKGSTNTPGVLQPYGGFRWFHIRPMGSQIMSFKVRACLRWLRRWGIVV